MPHQRLTQSGEAELHAYLAREEAILQAQLAAEGEKDWLRFQRVVVNTLLANTSLPSRQEWRRLAREYEEQRGRVTA